MSARVLTGALVLVLATPLTVRSQQPQSAIDELAVLTARLAWAASDVISDGTDLTALAERRAELLAELIDSAPGDVLRLALPSESRAILPDEARALTEEYVDLSGRVEVVYEDHRGFSRLQHVLDTGSARYSLHFSETTPDWVSGQRVRVRGVRLQNALALDGGEAAMAPENMVAALPAAAGQQRTLVVLVNFSDTTAQPYTAATAESVVFSQTDGYLRENSAGATWLTGDVVGWFTIALDSTVCDTAAIATQAQAAASDAGVTLSNYSRFVYAFPQNACTFWGRGSVGGNPSNAWINGEIALEVVGHELGHNLGLYHSRNMDCGVSPIGTNCTVDEYGDTLDLMGATRGHFNAFQKERLGWLAPSQIVTVTGSGSYAVEPFASLSGGVKALKILKSTDPATGKRTFYYLEQRQGVGYDGFMSTWTNVVNGFAIHTGSESAGNTSYLLDLTPETTSWYDPALTSGRTFTDPAAGLSLSTLSAGAAGGSVSITLQPTAPTCAPAAPRVTMTPGAPAAVNAGTTVTYTVSVTNLDSAGCAVTSFALGATVPAGWAGVLNASSLSLAPGSSGTTTLRVTSPATAAVGAYQVSARATDAANAARAAAGSASYSVAATPTLQLTTDRASYSRSETVVLTARVMSGTSPVTGVAVAFLIRKADGKTVRATVTSDAAGNAVYRLRLRPKDPVGAWQATTSATGVSSASVTFTIVS